MLTVHLRTLHSVINLDAVNLFTSVLTAKLRLDIKRTLSCKVPPYFFY